MNSQQFEIATQLPSREPANAVRYAVLDLETTGLSPRESNVVEIAIVELDEHGDITKEWTSLVNPPFHGELGATHIHGITREMVSGAPTMLQLADEIIEQLRDHIIVGHVVEFDLAHIIGEFERIGRPLPNVRAVSLCTRDLARSYIDAPRTLKACCDAVGIELRDAHSALGDTRATAQLFKVFLNRIQLDVDQSRLEDISKRKERLADLAWTQSFFHHELSFAQPRSAS